MSAVIEDDVGRQALDPERRENLTNRIAVLVQTLGRADLAVNVGAEAVNVAVGRQHQGVGGAGGHRNDGFVGEGRDLGGCVPVVFVAQAKLAVGILAPGVKRSQVIDGIGGAVAVFDEDDVGVVQRFDLFRDQLILVIAVAEAPEVAEAPGVDVAVFGQERAVDQTSGDRGDGALEALRQRHFHRRLDVVAFDADPQLGDHVLAAGIERVGVLVEEQREVVATADGGDGLRHRFLVGRERARTVDSGIVQTGGQNHRLVRIQVIAVAVQVRQRDDMFVRRKDHVAVLVGFDVEADDHVVALRQGRGVPDLHCLRGGIDVVGAV